jgi:hypothetical protein
MSRYDDILTFLETVLGTIEQANGYDTNAGFNVFLDLEYETEPEEIPCVITYPGEVTDSLEGNTPPGAGEENHYLPIKIEGHIVEDDERTQGKALRSDILKVLKSDVYFGGLTEGFEGSTTSVVVTEESLNHGYVSFVQVEFTIFYVTAWGGI